MAPPELGELRYRSHRYGIKVWFDTAAAPREHYEAQVIGAKEVKQAKVLALEVGFHAEYPKARENDAVIEHRLVNEKRWRKRVGPDAEVGGFLGRADVWRRVSETWADPNLSEPDLGEELAAACSTTSPRSNRSAATGDTPFVVAPTGALVGDRREGLDRSRPERGGRIAAGEGGGRRGRNGAARRDQRRHPHAVPRAVQPDRCLRPATPAPVDRPRRRAVRVLGPRRFAHAGEAPTAVPVAHGRGRDERAQPDVLGAAGGVRTSQRRRTSRRSSPKSANAGRSRPDSSPTRAAATASGGTGAASGASRSSGCSREARWRGGAVRTSSVCTTCRSV